jgi:hypothetical protein
VLYHFEYTRDFDSEASPPQDLCCDTSPSQLLDSGSGPVLVSTTVKGLTPGVLYYSRVVA